MLNIQPETLSRILRKLAKNKIHVFVKPWFVNNFKFLRIDSFTKISEILAISK
jgi:hypothetical protein